MGVPGVPVRFQRVKVNALVRAPDATQEQIDELARQVHAKCPVAGLFHDAGVTMDVSWKKKA